MDFYFRSSVPAVATAATVATVVNQIRTGSHVEVSERAGTYHSVVSI